jgi:hypothetical protein
MSRAKKVMHTHPLEPPFSTISTIIFVGVIVLTVADIVPVIHAYTIITLTVLYWNILADWIFCTAISLLTEYVVTLLEYPY